MLDSLKVLILDCQTTGSTPEKGHLLEMAWAVFQADGQELVVSDVTSRLVQLPDRELIPPPIAKMTGISAEEMSGAEEPREVWTRLGSATQQADMNPFRQHIAVTHYARFEDRFLRHLHTQFTPEESYPFRLVCTYEVARRLYPSLPNRGLRALSGFTGLHLPELKRATSQVLSIVQIWSHLVAKLARDHEVRSLGDLEAFLTTAPPPRGTRWSYPLPPAKRLGLPDQPGVYHFLGPRGEVLYVGKATSLKRRVNSYFQKRRPGDKILELVSQVHDVEVTPLETSLEAALLEAREIRSLSPPYNKALRDLGQEVAYYTPDLSGSQSTRDDRHRVGPIPNRESFDGIRLLVTVCRNARSLLRSGRSSGLGLFEDEQEMELARYLGLAPAELEPGGLSRGLEIFLSETLGKWRDADSLTARSFFSAGTRLLARRIAQSGDASAGAAAGAAEGAGAAAGELSVDDPTGSGSAELTAPLPPFRLTMKESTAARAEKVDTLTGPAEVVPLLEDFVVRASRLRRRSLWLRMLSESEVRWRTTDLPADQVRSLRVRGGRPVGVETVSRDRQQTERQFAEAAVLDRGSYDQLRVLSTELRALLSRGSEVEVLPKPGRSLGARWLRRILDRV